MMKKLATILAAMLLVSLLCGCAFAESGRFPAPYNYYLAEGGDEYVEGLIFNEDVIIYGNNATIMFENCEFNGDVILTADTFTRVMLMPNCVINGQLIINSGVVEGTIDTPLPKFLIFAPAEVVLENSYGAVIALGDFEVSFNGESYAIEDSQLFYDNANPENGMVAYEGQEANLLVVAQWVENGEEVLLVECEYDPTM